MAGSAPPTKYPTGGDYVDALQHPAITFTDPQLRAGTVRLDSLGMPQPVSGNFASVFHVTSGDGARWAIKCFTRPVADQQRRYQAICDALRSLNHSALVNFDYQSTGVMVSGVRYPLLKMRWVEAHSLLSWLEANHTDPARLTLIANQLVDVIKTLEEAGIAHGDLQHGNLLVTPSDMLTLIDYDGMYVPCLKGLPPTEKGLANYQHPTRSDRDFGPGLDRFSAWVIYTSLIALACDSSLWRQLRDSSDDTKLLLAAADYTDPTASTALATLRRTRQPQLIALADHIAALARTSLAKVPRLDPTSLPSLLTCPTPVLVSQPCPSDTTSGTPDWLIDHIPMPSQHTSPAAPCPDPAPARRGFTPGFHLTGARIAGMVFALAVCAVVAAMQGVPFFPAVPTAAWAALAAVAHAAIYFAYRFHPEVHARHQTHADYLQARTTTAQAESAFADVQELIVQLDNQHQRLRHSIDAQRATASQERQTAIDQAMQQLNQQLDEIKRERNDPKNSLEARQMALRQRLRNEHIHRLLAAASIAKNPPNGIDAKVIANLANKGFRTAADFVSYSIISGGRYDKAKLHRSPGSQGIYVEQVGPVRAEKLVAWRNKIHAQAERTAPTRLTDYHRHEATDQYQQHVQALQRRERYVRDTATTTAATAKTEEKRKQSELDIQQQRAEADFNTERRNLKRRQNGAANARANAANAERHHYETVASYETITLPRFVLATMGLNRL